MTFWLAILSVVILLDAVVVWCALVLSARADRQMHKIAAQHPGSGHITLYLGNVWVADGSKDVPSIAECCEHRYLSPEQIRAVAQARARNRG